MANLVFEKFTNVGSGKALTLADDGFLRQFGFNASNLNQHWMRLDARQPTRIAIRTSRRVIDVQTGVLVDNRPLQVFPNTGNPNQAFNISDTGDGDDAFFIFADGTQEVWDVFDASVDDRALIQIFGLNRGNNQRWRLGPDVSVIESVQAFLIRSLANNLVLDMPGFAQDDGVIVQQFNENGGFNQLWERVPTFDGREKIRCVSSRKVLDYPLGAALNKEVGVIGQYADNGGDNQQWFINKVGQDDFGRDIVNIVSAVPGNGFLLCVPPDSNGVGGRIQADPPSGGQNQQWVFAEPNEEPV
jgi:Ricin-type beta-trefoil lectin domain-like